jgi:hypothetical protein
MYCPNCAKENSGSEKYCRSCGLRLEFISKVAAAEAAGLSKRSIKSIEKSTGNTPYGPFRSPALFLQGFLIMMAGVLLAYLGKDVLVAHWVNVVGVIAVISGLSVIGYSQLARRPSLPSPDSPDTSPLDEVPESFITALPEPAPSVTEHTTKHLEPSPEGGSRRSGGESNFGDNQASL